MARVSVLQLDTQFPRIAGDVGCSKTFVEEVEVIRVPRATVARIVTGAPECIDLEPFLEAISRATGDVITTSCGFLAPFQRQLQAASDVPVVASALGQLEDLVGVCAPEDVVILTFDDQKLGVGHLPTRAADFVSSCVGLDPNCHLRDVIAMDRAELDVPRAAQDVCNALRCGLRDQTAALVLECTNLPPYKPQLRLVKDVPIYDILTAIETIAPRSIHGRFL